MKINNKLLPFSDYVVEQGTNYIKYNSGTMIQWGRATVTGELKTANGALYRPASEITQNFPKAFINNTASVTLTPHSALAVAYISSVTATQFKFWPNTLASSNSATRYVSWQAIGRWK